jgi:hypothetical protein
MNPTLGLEVVSLSMREWADMIHSTSYSQRNRGSLLRETICGGLVYLACRPLLCLYPSRGVAVEFGEDGETIRVRICQ